MKELENKIEELRKVRKLKQSAKLYYAMFFMSLFFFLVFSIALLIGGFDIKASEILLNGLIISNMIFGVANVTYIIYVNTKHESRIYDNIKNKGGD